MKNLSLLSCFASLAILAPTALTQTVTLLPGATPRGLSRDGVAATGWFAGQPFVWKSSTGFTALPGSVYNPRAVSDLGAVVVGLVDDPVSGHQSSGFWAAATGTWTPLGPFPGFGGCPGFGEALAVSADGSKIGGELFVNCNLKPYTWTLAGGYSVLPMTGGFGNVSTLSGDGQLAGGWDTHPTLGFRRAALWDAALNESFPLVSPANPSGSGEITAMNADGSIYAGIDDSGLGAFVYRNGTFTALGVPNNLPRPAALSDDGSVIVGSYGNIGVGFNPWVWTDCAGPQLGNSFFVGQGVHFPAGLTLDKVVGVSSDGSTFLASYSGFNGSGAVYIELPANWQATVYCQAKVNSQGCTPAICAQGVASLSLPVAFNVILNQTINNKPGLFFYSVNGPASTPFGGGTLCVASPLTRTAVQVSGGNPPPDDCSGTYQFDFNAYAQSGVDPSLTPGATVYGQYWARDPNHPDGTGIGLSDGVQFVLQP